MLNRGITPHESLKIDELLSFKNTCLTKSYTMSGLVSDDDLKVILQQDVDATQGHIEDLKNLLKTSTLLV